MGAIM